MKKSFASNAIVPADSAIDMPTIQRNNFKSPLISVCISRISERIVAISVLVDKSCAFDASTSANASASALACSLGIPVFLTAQYI